ncbi:MAG: ribosome small subunit-dependent GTPase A [Actinomycetes bacterium]
MTPRDLDEDDVRIRPKRSSRPRTKDRPDYSAAELARIIAVDRGRSAALIENTGIVVTAMKARELGKKSVVVGDIVRIVGDTSGKVDTLARIVAVEPRINELTRTVEDDAGMERMIVANVDQIGIVLAAASPEPRHGFVDRALVVAFDQRIKPLIIMTKCDLADPTEFLASYKDLDVESIQIQRGGDLTALHSALAGKRTVLLGHSGVGKSTLVNALVETANRATGDVNDVTGRGRHTSSSAIALELNDKSGWIIDTPGVRSFGLAHVQRDRVIGAFREFVEAIEHCPRNCSHDEEECALNSMITDPISLARLANLRGLLREGKLNS